MESFMPGNVQEGMPRSPMVLGRLMFDFCAYEAHFKEGFWCYEGLLAWEH